VTDPAFLSLAEAGRRIAARTLMPRDLTEAILDRIARIDTALKSFITLDAAGARAAADAAGAEIAAGRWRGPLHGIPVALKDAYDTAGLRTTVGSRLYAANVPTKDAFAWAQLKAAGAVLLGKLETTELCYGGPSKDALFTPSRNPWDHGCYAGGSSSGAGVAVASGLCFGALGTDTGGSIRLPAAYCGITGLMCSTGLVSRSGVFPLSYSFDHFGPMARSAEDCALMLNAIVGYDAEDMTSVAPPRRDYHAGIDRGIEGLRIGTVAAAGEARFVSPDMAAATRVVAEVLRARGAILHEVPFPDLADFAACQFAITLAEGYALHEQALQTRRRDIGYFTRTRLSLGPFVRGYDYVAAQRLRRDLVDAYDRLMTGCDLVLLPGAPGEAPPAAQVGAFDFMKKPLVTVPANVLGAPAIALPAGFGPRGLPLSVQLMGRRYEEALVLRAGHAFQQATDWHTLRPRL